jgi:hypothetical protein
MMQVGQHWVCGAHEQPVSVPVADSTSPAPPSPFTGQVARLPSILALPLHEFAAETHPVLRLHRLCDAVEILTRFATIAALGELRMRLGDAPLPDDLLRELQPRIEYPTFGKWRGMLAAVTRAGRTLAGPVVPELSAFVEQHLLPALPGGERSRPEECLITLRNNLVHGGAMTRAEAARFLATWEPWLASVLPRLAFLEAVDLCHLADSTARRLVGPDAEGPERVMSASLRYAVRALDDHLVLLRDDRWVDLWPLCDYRHASQATLHGTRRASHASPLI